MADRHKKEAKRHGNFWSAGEIDESKLFVKAAKKRSEAHARAGLSSKIS